VNPAPDLNKPRQKAVTVRARTARSTAAQRRGLKLSPHDSRSTIGSESLSEQIMADAFRGRRWRRAHAMHP